MKPICMPAPPTRKALAKDIDFFFQRARGECEVFVRLGKKNDIIVRLTELLSKIELMKPSKARSRFLE